MEINKTEFLFNKNDLLKTGTIHYKTGRFEKDYDIVWTRVEYDSKKYKDACSAASEQHSVLYPNITPISILSQKFTHDILIEIFKKYSDVKVQPDASSITFINGDGGIDHCIQQKSGEKWCGDTKSTYIGKYKDRKLSIPFNIREGYVVLDDKFYVMVQYDENPLYIDFFCLILFLCRFK